MNFYLSIKKRLSKSNFPCRGVALLSLLAFCDLNAQQVSTFKIDPTEKYQTIEHFGASDCWSMQAVGLWSEPKTKQIADWLFSLESGKNGQPKGIGLSMWRFNIGAGSTEQGEESQIGSPWMRTECFQQADGSYNWEKQKGQRNFLKLAKERGVNKFLGFFNSPPVYFTQNGLATNTGRGGTFNLKPDCYDDFALFMSNVAEGLEKHDGIHLDYICPVNEPDGHWNWIGPKQEGTPATNREIAHLIKETSKQFASRGLSTQILLPESFDYNCIFRVHPLSGPARGNQVQTFFSGDSADTYLGNLPNVPRRLVGHSYWTTTPLTDLKNIRRMMNDSLQKYKVGFWETEVCIMGNDIEIGGGGGYDRTMKTALYVTRIIHHDLVYANAGSWQWWRAIGGDYKDGLLRMFTDRMNEEGDVVDSKLLWCLGNYSRFIRPGAIRIGVHAYDKNRHEVADGTTDQQGVMTSAYKNSDGSTVVVMINYANHPKKARLSVDKAKMNWKSYRTSDVAGEDLLPVGRFRSNQEFSLPARSVTTFVSE